MGLCLWQNKLCQILVCLLARDDAAAMDISSCQCRAWERPVCSPAQLNSAFAQVPVDQMIEQTMNRESNTKAGISLNRGAVQRWILTAHDRAKTLQTSREMTSIYDSESKQHKDASVPRMKEDKNDVHKGMDTIESWINPFKSRDPNEPLSSIASGVKTTDDIAEHLLTAEQEAMMRSQLSLRRDCKQVTSTCSLNGQMPNYRRSKIWSCQRKPKPLKVISSSRLIEACLPGWTS